jgi:hypothetical protein
MKLLNLKRSWHDYFIVGLPIIALIILIIGYYTTGWFCITFENVDIEDSGERCFKTISELKNYSDTIFNKYNTSEYTKSYTTTQNIINNSVPIVNYSGDDYGSLGRT